MSLCKTHSFRTVSVTGLCDLEVVCLRGRSQYLIPGTLQNQHSEIPVLHTASLIPGRKRLWDVRRRNSWKDWIDQGQISRTSPVAPAMPSGILALSEHCSRGSIHQMSFPCCQFDKGGIRWLGSP